MSPAVAQRTRIEALGADVAGAEPETERRVLGLIPATGVVVSSMVGTGIFTTTGLLAGMGGGGGDILLAWFLGGIIALCGALCYGEIGANLPKSGGEYHYLTRLLHPSAGVVAGWVSLIAGFAAPIAASAVVMHLYVASVIPAWPARTLAVVTILVCACLHAHDLRLGTSVQTGLAVGKVLLLVAFIAGGGHLWWTSGLRNTLEFSPSFWVSPSFAVMLVFVSFAYSGWNAAAYVATEVHAPQRTLPRALLLGASSVTVLYMLVNAAYLAAVPVSHLSGQVEIAHQVAGVFWGPIGAFWVPGLIALAQLCPISVMIMIGPRVIEAMARDRRLPLRLARLNTRGTPSTAVWCLAGLASALVVTSSFRPLLLYIGFTLNLFAALTVCCLFRLRERGESRHRVCVGYPLPPLVFLTFALWTTVWSIREEPWAAAAGAGTLLLAYFGLAFRTKDEADLRARDREADVSMTASGLPSGIAGDSLASVRFVDTARGAD